MAFTSYTTLKSTIADYLARSDLTTQIPDFIRLAEERLRRDLRIRQMLKVATANTIADDSTVSLPSDFLAMKDLHLDTTPVRVLQFQNTSNLFLANCPDLILYGALAESEPYLMNDERLATWSALYDRGLASLRASDDDGEYPSSPMSITLSTR